MKGINIIFMVSCIYKGKNMLDLERIISVIIRMYIMFFKVYKRFWFYRFCLINIKNIVKLCFGF